MTENERTAEKEAVLFAFQLAHPRPGPADVAGWIRLHPEHEEDLIEHAAFLLEAALDGDEAAPLGELQAARGRSRALEALFRAEARAAEGQAPASTFERLLTEAGKTVPALARELDIGRGVLTDLLVGRMAVPMGRRLAAALQGALAATAESLASAHRAANAAPRLGLAKGEGAVAAIRQTYAEIVSADGSMSDARKAFWLGED